MLKIMTDAANTIMRVLVTSEHKNSKGGKMFEVSTTIYYKVDGRKTLYADHCSFVDGYPYSIDDFVSAIWQKLDNRKEVKTIEIFDKELKSMGVFEIDRGYSCHFHCNRVPSERVHNKSTERVIKRICKFVSIVVDFFSRLKGG